MIYTNKDKQWIDEAGISIPSNRLTSFEKLKEVNAKKVITKAMAINKSLADFKNELKEVCDAIYSAAAKENNIKPDAKGNFTWFSFDRSIKIEVSIKERIDFDDLTIKASKEKFDRFLDLNIESKAAFAKDLINEAFSTSRGKLDTKKIMSLIKYRDKIKDALFQEAISLLEKSIRRPDSKRYFQVWQKDGEGEYQLIDLNFSSI